VALYDVQCTEGESSENRTNLLWLATGTARQLDLPVQVSYSDGSCRSCLINGRAEKRTVYRIAFFFYPNPTPLRSGSGEKSRVSIDPPAAD
jgi:hypothetical protein